MNKMGNVAGQFSRTLILLLAGILIALALTAVNAAETGWNLQIGLQMAIILIVVCMHAHNAERVA